MLRDLAGGSLVYGLGEMLSRLLAFVAIPILTAYLTPAEYGSLGLLLTVGGLVGAIGGMGVNNAVQRFYFDSGDTAVQGRIAATGWILQSVCFMVAMALTSLVAWTAGDMLSARFGLTAGLLGLAIAGAFFAQLVQYGLDLYRLEFRPAAYSIAQGARGASAAVAAVVLIAGFGFGIEGILIANLACAAILALYLAVVSGRRYGWTGSRSDARRMLSYGWPFISVGIVTWGQGSIDRWLISSLAGLAEAGAYTVAATFAGLLGFVITAFAQAWSPYGLRLRRDHPEDYRRIFSLMWMLWGYILLVLAAGLMLLAPEIIRLMTAPAYHDSASILVVLAASAAIAGTCQMTGIGISLSCRTGVFAWATAAALALSLGMGLLLVPWLSALGAAIATLAGQVLLTSIYASCTQRLHPLPIRWLPLLGLAACGILVMIVALVWSTRPWSWWFPIAKGLALAILASWLWYRLDLWAALGQLGPRPASISSPQADT